MRTISEGEKASARVGCQSKTLNTKIIKDALGLELFNRFNVEKMPYFSGATSAKVRKSEKKGGYINAVVYLSPADQAMVSFINQFPDMVASVKKSLETASKTHSVWKPFTLNSKTRFESVVSTIKKAQSGKPTLDYTPIAGGNAVRMFSLCPESSPNCRAVCLNTSGHGGDDPTKKSVAKRIESGKASGLVAGITASDDWQYWYLRGVSPYYAGQTNAPQGARVLRTHIMWLMWAVHGVIQNPFNDMLYYEALKFKQEATGLNMPVAFRMNGVSDIPVETLTLSGINDPKLKGKNLIVELGKKGIVCYDYTKSYERMASWLKANVWRKLQTPALESGWPTNYYLAFSWSEVNASESIKVLRAGGNVVMVFRRSVDVERTEKFKLPSTAGRKGDMPTKIAVGQLDPSCKDWVVDIVNGDITDLRFLDPHNVGKPNGGVVVGLIGKAGARKPYDDAKRRSAWGHFTSPARLIEKDGEKYIEIKENPNAGKTSIIEVDPDIYNRAVSVVDGYVIGTTASGT